MTYPTILIKNTNFSVSYVSEIPPILILSEKIDWIPAFQAFRKDLRERGKWGALPRSLE
jgi:hypothetical protein